MAKTALLSSPIRVIVPPRGEVKDPRDGFNPSHGRVDQPVIFHERECIDRLKDNNLGPGQVKFQASSGDEQQRAFMWDINGLSRVHHCEIELSPEVPTTSGTWCTLSPSATNVLVAGGGWRNTGIHEGGLQRFIDIFDFRR